MEASFVGIVRFANNVMTLDLGEKGSIPLLYCRKRGSAANLTRGLQGAGFDVTPGDIDSQRCVLTLCFPDLPWPLEVS